MALGWDWSINNHKSETKGFKPDWHQPFRGEYFTKSHDRPAAFTRLQFTPFVLCFIGIIAAWILALVAVATVALLFGFYQSVTANRSSGLCKHTGATPWRDNLLSSARGEEREKAYQQNNRLSFLVEQHLYCRCYSWRTCCCSACLLMWHERTWCSCPVLFCLESLILQGCIRAQSHAVKQVASAWKTQTLYICCTGMQQKLTYR